MRIICEKCKGNGYYREPMNGTDHAFGILSIGISYLISLASKDEVVCRICDGKGYIENNK